MNRTSTRMSLSLAATAMAGIALTASSANAALVVEEQFDYTAGNLDGQNGGTGFDAAWVNTGWIRNYVLGLTSNAGGAMNTVNASGGMDFPGLDTAGLALSRFGTAGQRAVFRAPSAGSLTALTGDNTTMWFSLLAGAPSGNKYGTFVFGTDTLMAQQSGAPFPNGNMNAAAGQGFGVGFRTDNAGSLAGGSGSPNAVAFINSDSATVAVGSYIPPILGTHHDTTLVVGKINWNANGTPDELFLFNITDPSGAAPAEGSAIASLSADFDQSTWDTISMWDTGATLFDEIRMGNTFGDVTPGVPEPSSAALFGLGGLALLFRRRR